MTGPPADGGDRVDGGGGVRFHVADTVVARVAAQAARRVPGVAGTGDVVATVHDGSTDVAIELVALVGHNCRDLAQAVQRDVMAEVAAYTGLPAVVTVTVTDVLLD